MHLKWTYYLYWYRKKTGKTLSILYDTGETATYGFVDDFHQLPYTTVNAEIYLPLLKMTYYMCRWKNMERC